VAIYFNRGDLGIGREMHCIRDNDDETACYVLNFGARDGTPRFNSIGDSLQALNAHKPFATVAMVERGKMKADDPNKVFFVVYDANGKLLDTAPLDNKGFNTFIPGNCLVCHGSGSAYTPSKLGPDGETVEDGPKVVGARFLPFDLSSFLYFSSDSENKFSREKQEP
jgi:hypothetical protein